MQPHGGHQVMDEPGGTWRQGLLVVWNSDQLNRFMHFNGVVAKCGGNILPSVHPQQIQDGIANTSQYLRSRSPANAARILARLHSRTKSSEQGRQAQRGNMMRLIAEDDGLLAIRLFGFILQDLEYAEA